MQAKKMCPVGTEIQTLIFAHEAFKNEDYVKAWAREHDFKYGQVDETETSWRIRQQEPENFLRDSFRTITITDGISAVIACPKDKKDSGGELTWMEIGDSEKQAIADYRKELDELNKGVQYCLGQIAEAKEAFVKKEYKQVMNDRLRRIHEVNLTLREIEKMNKKEAPSVSSVVETSPEIWKHKHMSATAKILSETAKGYKVELTDNTAKRPKVTTQYFNAADFKGNNAIFEKQSIWDIELPEDYKEPYWTKHMPDVLSIGEKIATVLGKKILKITGDAFNYSNKGEVSIDIIYHFADSTSVKLVGKPYDGYLLCIYYHDITAPVRYRMYKSSEEYDLFKKEDVFAAVNEILQKIKASNINFEFSAGGKVDSFSYRMLDRLRTDNDYFLGNGNRSEKHLWAGNVDAQIAEMKRLWNYLPQKPEWLSMEEILEYERKMKTPNDFGKAGSLKTITLTETESPYAQLVISARDWHSFQRMCTKIEADDSISETQYMNMLDAVARTYGLDASRFENKSIGDYKQAIYDAAKNTTLHIQTAASAAGLINFDKAPVKSWNVYLEFVEGIDGIISEYGALPTSYWKNGVQDELDSITESVKTKAGIIANKVRIINNATDLLDGLTGIIGSGKISEYRYFKPGAIAGIRKMLSDKFESGGSAGEEKIPSFTNDEMTIMRQVYYDRINGIFGKKSYLDTGNAKQWHSENSLSLSSAKQNADKELEDIKSDVEYLNSQKYPFDIISSAYDCEKFLNDYNDLVKTKAGRELFNDDNPNSDRLYKVYISLYDKLLEFCEKKFGRTFALGGNA